MLNHKLCILLGKLYWASDILHNKGKFFKKIYPFFVSSTIEVDAFTAKIYEIYEKTRKEGLVQVNCPLLRHFLAIHSLS